MAERQFQEETQNLSLGNSDFAEDLTSFGVEDTQVLGKNQLDSFLLSDPSSNQTKVTKVVEEEEDDENTEDTPPATQVQTKEKKAKPEKNKDTPQEVDKQKALDSWLTSDEEEEDEEVDKKPDPKKAAKKEDVKEEEDDEDDNTFNILSKDLFKLGVFTKGEDEKDEVEIKTPEQFLERFNIEKGKQASEMLDSFLGKFGDEYRQMFDSVFVKGVDPKDYLASHSKIETFKNLDLSKPDIQERVFFQYYRDQGLSEERISKRFDKIKDLGELDDEVKDMHEILLQKEEKNIVKLEQEKQKELEQKQQRENMYQTNVGTILQNKLKAGDFDGIPVTQKEARDTYAYMTQKPYKLPSGELITEMHKDWLELDRPENHELKVKVALLLKNKMDLSKVVKKAVSASSDSLFSDLTNKKKTSRGEPKTSPTNSSSVKSFFE